MTNEELAIAYQAAAQEDKSALIGELWEQNTGILAKLAYRFFTLHSDSCVRAGQTLDDLKQIAFFALCDAAEAFKSELGYSFTSYLKFPAANRFNEAIGKRRSIPDPLNICTSLDKPIYSDKDGGEIDALGGAVEDPRQTDLLEEAEQAIYTRQLHEALEKGISELADDQQRVLRLRYFQNLTQKQCGSIMGCGGKNIGHIEQKAIRRMRNPKRLKYLKSYHNDVIKEFAWSGLGFCGWLENGASGVERAVEKAEEKTERKFDRWFML